MPIDPSIPLSAVARAPSEPFNPLVTLQQVAQIAALRAAQENRAQDAAARAEDQAFQREERTYARARRERIDQAWTNGVKRNETTGELEIDYPYLTQHLPGDQVPGVIEQLKNDKKSALAIQELESRLADLRRAHRREAADTITAAKGDPIIAGVEFRGAHALGALSEEELEQALGLETPEQILAAVAPYRTRLPERAPVPVQTVGAGGAPETRFVQPEAGVSYPTPPPVRAPVQVATVDAQGRPMTRFVTPEVGASYPTAPPERAPVQPVRVDTVDAQGRPVTKFVTATPGAEYPQVPKAAEGIKLSPAQQEDIAAMLTVQDLGKEALRLGTEIGWAGVGPIEGYFGPKAAKWLGRGDPKAETLRNLVGNIQGTIAKLRGGTAFSAQEQIMLDRYTPTPTDSDFQIQTKLKSLSAFIEAKRANTLRVAAGVYTPRSGPLPAVTLPKDQTTGGVETVRDPLGDPLMPDTLAQKIRAKYPGAYDDLDDAVLEAQVRAKFPGVYDDIPSTPRAMQARIGPGTPEALERSRIGPVPERSAVGSLGAFLGEALQSFNPAAITGAVGQVLSDIKEGDPKTLRAMGQAQGKLFYDAQAAYEQGDYTKAAARFLEYLIPVMGPRLAQASELLEAGEPARGLGAAVDVAGQLVQPKLVAGAVPVVNRAIEGGVNAVNRIRLANPNAATNAAAEAGRAAGVRVDTATATGNPLVQGSQALLEKSTAGAVVGQAERALRARQMERWGTRLAEEVSPTPVTPQAAAEGLQQELRTGITDYHGEATGAYNTFRAIEDRPEFAEKVRTAPPGSRAERAILDKLEANAPDKLAPSPEELGVMRQIQVELAEQPGTKYQLQPEQYGGGYEHVEGTGGAASQTYHDVIKHATPGEAPWGSSADMARGVQQTLETGRWNQSSLAVRELARRRLRSSGALGGPRLPPDTPLVGGTEVIQLPVDLGPFRQAMEPEYTKLLREKELGPLYGQKREALAALDKLMTGPEFERASIVDSVLGDLKGFARDPEAGLAALRTEGQGVAAQAVGQLEQQVQAAVARAGPEAQGALEIGRLATRRKYDLRDALRVFDQTVKNPKATFEPVKAFELLTTGHPDSQIARLRQVAKEAPNRMPAIGRATLQGLLEKATAEGGFGRGDFLWREWEKLGPDTRTILFSDKVPEIDNFMLLSKRFADNPNPSGSALVGSVGVQGLASWLSGLGPALVAQGGALAATGLLFNPRFAKLVTQGLRITAPSAHAPAAAQAAALAQITRAMREAGLEVAPVAVPRAAETQERRGR